MEVRAFRSDGGARAGSGLPRAAAACLLLLLAGCAGVRDRPGGPPPVVAAAPEGARLADLARGLVGTSYRYGGASPDGFDCSGLVWYLHRQIGVAVPRTAAEQRAAAAPLRREELAPGDLVFFSTPRDHVGIYVGDGEFVHAPATGRRVERARLDAPWFLLAFSGAGRLPRGP
jgi:hypothetical protein